MRKPTVHIQREITPLAASDCLLVFDRRKSKFDFPVHFHPEYELNFIENAPDAQRLVGDHKGYIGQTELVLVGPNLHHGWNNGLCQSDTIHEITIQFHRDLIHESLLNRNMMAPVKELLDKSSHGILFSEATATELAPKIYRLAEKNGIEAFTSLLSILNVLALSSGQQQLCDVQFTPEEFVKNNRIRRICEYIEKNYQEKIKIAEAARSLKMTETTLSRLMKQQTGRSFIDFLNDYRIGFATRWLTETNQTISEIAFRCGFYNISNFNRIFKKSKGCTPGEYRENFSGIKKVS